MSEIKNYGKTITTSTTFSHHSNTTLLSCRMPSTELLRIVIHPIVLTHCFSEKTSLTIRRCRFDGVHS